VTTSASDPFSSGGNPSASQEDSESQSPDSDPFDLTRQNYNYIAQRLRLRHDKTTTTDEAEATGQSRGNSVKQSFSVTENQKPVSASGMTRDKKTKSTTKRQKSQLGPISVVSLLEEGTSLNDLQRHIRGQISTEGDASLPVRLTNAVNVWLRLQDTVDSSCQLTLVQKRAVVEFVELLQLATQCQLFRRGEPCRFDVDVDSKQPEGTFRARAVGASQGIRRVRLSDLLDDAPFEFMERSVEEGESRGESPSWKQTVNSQRTKKGDPQKKR
jgi:hypothetical protein